MPWGAIGGAAIGALGSLIGGHKNNNAAAEAAAREYQNQKEFAQNGVRWKVADAKAAGIHPLAALGAQTFAYNPVAVQTGDGGIGDALTQMGQGVSRAFEAKRLREEREADEARREMEDVFNLAMRNKQLEQMDLQNDVMRQQIRASQVAIEKAALPPPMPSTAINERATGLISREDAAYHVWNMGNGNYSVLWNPNFTQSIGDETGQLFNLAEAAKNAYLKGIWIDPETGKTYAYNKSSGWWNRRPALSPEETRRFFGMSVPPSASVRSSSPVNKSHFERNKYRYRY